ncbi:hypothetical protein TNCV_4776831 [Trichonephila clavipes]|nr:hypothetical protein TNCV_4776831 [Trichonephila clavipes]
MIPVNKSTRFAVAKRAAVPVVKVSEHGRHVTSSSPVPLKTRRVEERCTQSVESSNVLQLVVRRGGASSGVVLVT